MKRVPFFRAVLSVLLLVPHMALADIVALPGTRIENLTAPLRAARVWLTPASDFEVVGSAAWLLAGDNRMVDLGSGKSILPKGFEVHSFARTPAGAVAVVTENILGTVQRGMFLPAVKLPFGNMRVTAGPRDTLLLHGGPPDDQHLIAFDGTGFSTMVRMSEPFGVVTAVADRVFFTAANRLYTVAWGESPSLLFVLPGDSAISGVAVNAGTGELYVATSDALFVLAQGVAIKKLQGLGGRLQFRDGKLYLLDASQGLLVRVLLK